MLIVMDAARGASGLLVRNNRNATLVHGCMYYPIEGHKVEEEKLLLVGMFGMRRSVGGRHSIDMVDGSNGRLLLSGIGTRFGSGLGARCDVGSRVVAVGGDTNAFHGRTNRGRYGRLCVNGGGGLDAGRTICEDDMSGCRPQNHGRKMVSKRTSGDERGVALDSMVQKGSSGR